MLPFASERVMEELFDGLYCVDRERRILYWNRAAAGLTGYEAEEVIGGTCATSLLSHTDGEGRDLCRGRCPMARTMGCRSITSGELQ